MLCVHVVIPWWQTPKFNDMPETGASHGFPAAGGGQRIRGWLQGMRGWQQQVKGGLQRCHAVLHTHPPASTRPPARPPAEVERKRREKRERQEARASKFRR